MGRKSQKPLLAESRRSRILEWVQEEGNARVKDLSETLNVSEATIRHDLAKLETEGFITREHGGAFLRSVPKQVQTMSLHHADNMLAKQKIGRLAAELVCDAETLIIDAGTTTTEFAMGLKNKSGLNAITSALNIALMLGSNPTNTIHMPAGQFKAPTLSLSGESSSQFFKDKHAEKLFLATAGISFSAGLTYPSMGDLYLKRAMVAVSATTYLLADSTKINKTSLLSLGPITMIDTLITDDAILEAECARFEDAGIEVLIA